MLRIFKKIVRRGAHLLGFTIIDIGANVGQFAQEILKLFPDARIYCFEPLPNIHQELLQWTQTTGGRVTAYNVAVGEREDIVPMYHHADHHYVQGYEDRVMRGGIKLFKMAKACILPQISLRS